MAVIPTVEDWEAGEDLDAAKFNANIRDVGNFVLRDRPIAIVNRAVTTQTLVNNDEIIFDTVSLDTDNMVDLGSFPTRITIKTAGFYLINMQVPYSDDGTGSAGGYRLFRVLRNGSDEVFQDVRNRFVPTSGLGTMGIAASSFEYCNVNDYLEIEIGHDANTFTTRTLGGGVTLSAMWMSQ